MFLSSRAIRIEEADEYANVMFFIFYFMDEPPPGGTLRFN